MGVGDTGVIEVPDDYVPSVCEVDALKINEVHPRGDPEDWLEIINIGDVPCNLRGWKLYDQYDYDGGFEDDGAPLTFRDAILGAGGIWFGCDEMDKDSQYSDCELADVDRPLPSGLDSGGETYYLRHPDVDHQDAHYVSYNFDYPDSYDESMGSLQRCGDSYVWSGHENASPGKPNVCPLVCGVDTAQRISPEGGEDGTTAFGWRSTVFRHHMAMTRNDASAAGALGYDGTLTVDDVIVVNEDDGSARSVRDWLQETSERVARVEAALSFALSNDTFVDSIDFSTLSDLPEEDSRRPLWFGPHDVSKTLSESGQDLTWSLISGEGIEAPASLLELNLNQSDPSLCDSTSYTPTFLMGSDAESSWEAGYFPTEIAIEGVLTPNSSLGVVFDVQDGDNFFRFDARLDADGKKICQVMSMRMGGVESVIGKIAYDLSAAVSLAHVAVDVQMHGDTARANFNIDGSLLVLDGSSEWTDTVSDLGSITADSLQGRVGTPHRLVPLRMPDWRGNKRLSTPRFMASYYAGQPADVDNAAFPTVYELKSEHARLAR